jgi:nitrogen regulatory protein PII
LITHGNHPHHRQPRQRSRPAKPGTRLSGPDHRSHLIPKVRLDIAVNDAFVDITCDTILRTAKSPDGGKVGDGKIFITHLEQCIRIRTEETGSKAI